MWKNSKQAWMLKFYTSEYACIHKWMNEGMQVRTCVCTMCVCACVYVRCVCIIIIYLTASGLSPGGSGYFTFELRQTY
jgi:hypothetical protein